MAYSDFTLAELKQRFGLTVSESVNLFGDLAAVELPKSLAATLERYLPLAINANTEKARSELIIAPVLIELKLLYADRISLFSGIEFTIDESMGLKGRCDYILAQSPEQLTLSDPVCTLVEAKNENILAGIPQCLAEMVAARQFNRSAQTPERAVFGAVTTGMIWRFLKLDGATAFVDTVEYPIQAAGKIFAILTAVALENRPAR